ncbi:phage tail sheath family protein [Nostoc sp. C052]|uniref:phage tail sheath family protein n=1 Tax=Nostoc sp. C052 TaxID=2576902 RepID=UPI0015C2E51A|nr:phage tail sheath family protein [Nostoc sp. C052]QLE44368.1 phage tail sheath family protein [Nostoc sp. C052]
MPITPTYPGVYIEEIPSGVRTITGVSTSNTGFVDFFERGPVNTPIRITSFADFQRTFGGLFPQSEASYAIQQFYLNGGQIAWVVRVATTNMTTAGSATHTLGANSLRVDALSVGDWGNHVQVKVDQDGLPTGSVLFNLTVKEVNPINNLVTQETYGGVTMDATKPRYVVEVVNRGSVLVRLARLGNTEPANLAFTALTGGLDTDVMDNLGNLVAGQEAAFATALKGSDTVTIDADNIPRKSGIYALSMIAPYIFNILCLPATAKLVGVAGAAGSTARNSLLTAAQEFCLDKRAFLIMDVPFDRTLLDQMQNPSTGFAAELDSTLRHPNTAIYFPNLTLADPLNQNKPRLVGASGTMAGIYARTDAARGVWKAPAGTDADLRGVSFDLKLSDLENGGLNPLGINVIRSFPVFGSVSWGARTLKGADQEASEWKYIPVRRTALFIEESLYQGLKWVVFEPNDEPLWAQIRLNIGAFMNNLFRQGAFQGKTPREAYLVKCDKETTTQNDINLGIVNIVVGFAPLKPAEFVIVKIQQLAGQIAV